MMSDLKGRKISKEFKLSDEEHKHLLDRCKPVLMIALQCGEPPSPQENANAAWKELGEKLGFDYMTVAPVRGKDSTYFTAGETPPERGALNDE